MTTESVSFRLTLDSDDPEHALILEWVNSFGRRPNGNRKFVAKRLTHLLNLALTLERDKSRATMDERAPRRTDAAVVSGGSHDKESSRAAAAGPDMPAIKKPPRVTI